MVINGKTRLLGLIGNPVEHTLSPAIHNSIGLCDTVYVPFHVEKGALSEAVKGAYALNVLGMNVTVPYKQDVIEELVDIDPLAKKIGAVNTLVRVDGGYKGYNTDAIGFLRELDFYGVKAEGKAVVMLGAGGASRAVAFALAQKSPAVIYIANRSIQKAKELADSVNKYEAGELAIAITYDELSSLNIEDFILVQCTSVGLSPDNDSCVIDDIDFMSKAAAGVDLIYKPCETRFMKYLRSAGIPAYNGLRMLLYQGIAAYELFNDVVVPSDKVEIATRCLEKAAGINRPLILEGYMGSGKSSVASRLSKRLDCMVIDTDQEIEKREGISINEIFATKGEEAFRDMETALITELMSREDFFVLSLGGGLPVREKNRELLRALGTVVYLKTSPEETCKRLAGDTTRPLLKGGDLMDKVNSMLAVRGPLYEDAAGVILETDGNTPAELAYKITDILKL